MKISNYHEILDELVNLMIDFDVRMSDIETDVYMYIRNGTATLETFVNPGGNSWRDDDHITIYSDPRHEEEWPLDEDGNPVSEEVYREYLEDMRSDYVEWARTLLEGVEWACTLLEGVEING